MTASESQDKLHSPDSRLELVLDAIRAGLWQWNVQTGETLFDQRWAEIVGYTIEDLEPVSIQTWINLTHPDDLTRSKHFLDRHFAGEASYYECECRMRHKDGRWVWVLDRGRVVSCSDDGRPLWMTGTHIDITAQKTAELNERQSRENFETLFNTIRDFLFVLDEEGRILHANDAAVRRLGYSLADLKDLPVQMLHPAERRAEAEKTVLAMLSGAADSCAVPLISRYGELLPVETHVTAGKWNGKPVLFGISVDIAKRKQAEDTLSLRESHLSAILENLPGLVWLKDAESRFLAVNTAFAVSCGRNQPEELNGKTDLDIWPQDLAEQYRRDDFSVIQTKQPVQVEEPIADKDGTRWFETFKTPVIGGQGTVVGTAGYARDITQRKQMQESLSRQTTLLTNLLDSIPDIVFFKDIEGVYLGCNPLFEEVVGKSRREIIGHTDYDIFSKEVADAFRENDRIMMAQNTSRHNEEWITYPDGRRILIDTLKAPLIAADGRVIGMLGVSRDITDRKRSEDALVQQSLLQKILMDIATTYINLPLEEVDKAIQTALKDLGEFVEADRAYIFDYNFPGGICKNTFEWCREGISPQIDALQAVPLAELPDWIATHRQSGAVYYPDIAALPPGGVRDILEPQQIKSLLTIPLVYGNDCLGFVGFDSVRHHHAYSDKERTLLSLFAQMLTNIRLRRQNEAALVTAVSRANELAGKAAAAGTAKSMFLAHMSHEIRTPLNAVLGWAQILNRDCKTCSAGRVAAKAIIKGGEHLLELINDILDLVRSDAGIMVLKPVGFDFREMLGGIVLMHRQQGISGINIETVIDPDIPRDLFADKCKIRQVLINLISNAISFTQHGGVCIAASVKECSDGERLMMSVDVIDSGCGIESDQFERIFKPFEQLNSGQQKRKGSGLGLPLSRRYAQAMGGDVVVVSSVPGKGSAFRFTFTVQRGKADLAGSTESSLPVKQIASGQTILRILAVDDDPANLQMLQSMLEEAGFAVETAESGACALDKIRAGNGFDLVLMDRRMPGMDGLETIRNLRNLCPGQKIPVVMVTANEPDEGAAEPVDGYVSKPVSRNVLFKEIQRITGVQYEYDSAAAAPSGCRYAAAPDAFRPVSSAQREALQNAVDAGDVRRMRDVSEDIRRDYPALAEVLDDLISRYDYDELNRLLKQDEGVA